MKKKLIITGIILLSIIIILFGIVFISFGMTSIVTKGQVISNYSNPKKAMLVIDMQRCLTEKEGKLKININQSDEAIKNINKIIDRSNDLGIIIVYITNEWDKFSIPNLVTGGVLQKGADTARIDSRIKLINSNFFIKEMMDSFTNPKLDEFFINNQINHLYITGLDASACVDRTIKAALNRKYIITVVKDAVVTESDEKREKKINEFKNLGCNIILSNELLK